MQTVAHAENETRKMSTIEPLITQDQIHQEIQRVAKAIDAEYQGEEITLIMVMKGAICLAADLIRELKTPCNLEFIKASSYGQRGTKRGELKIEGLDTIDLSSKNVVLIDDIFDSGQTLSQIAAKIQAMKPKSLKSLVLLLKNVERDVTYLPDYSLFPIEDEFVIGYGLDYKEYYRGLPGIFVLNLE
jgi:hypoxanthine phosphoribosyltransferase